MNKYFRLSFLPVFVLASLHGEDIETLKHQVYKNATVSRAEPDGIVVVHDAGIVKIPFTELPDDYKTKFGYDADSAKKFAAADAEKQRALAAKIATDTQTANAAAAEIYSANAKDVDASAKRRAISGFVLDAKEVGTTDTSYDTWKTDYGSYDRRTMQDKKINVGAHDVSGNSAICKIDIYFVGVNGGYHFVYARQSASVTVQKGIEARTTITAPRLDSRTLNLAALDVSYYEGAVMEGWIAVGRIEGQQFGSVCSQQVVCNAGDGLIADFEAREKKALAERDKH